MKPKFLKSTVSLLLSLMLLVTAALASEAYGPEVYRSQISIGSNTYLDRAIFWSDTYGTLRSEAYLEYTPNSTVFPLVDYGDYIRGATNVSSVYTRLKNKGLNMLGGINGDYFVMATGESLGIVITDGLLRSSSSYHWAVGFNADGTAFIAKPQLQIKVTTASGESFYIANVNKDRSIDGGAVLYTEDYGKETYNTASGTNVVIENLSGGLSVGGTVSGTVKETLVSSTSVAIGKGQMVLSIDSSNDSWRLGLMNAMAAGDAISVEVTAADSRWSGVKYAIGGMYALVENGTAIKGLETATPPRTAVGVTAEGNVIFYTSASTTDGAATSLNQVAVRLEELGCVEAICLDGGGSTTLSALYPGNSSLSTINNPSDGSLRNCSNYIVLATAVKSDGVPHSLWLYPYDAMLLSGATLTLTAKATDAAMQPAAVPAQLSYSVTGGVGTVTTGGVFTAGAAGTGSVVVSSGSLNDGAAVMKVIETPDSIVVKRESTGAAVTSLSMTVSEKLELTAQAFYNHIDLISQDKCYTWSVEGDIGSITETGLFTASGTFGKGSIVVVAGGKTVKIPVTVGVDSEGPVIEMTVTGSVLTGKVTDPSGASVVSLKYDGKPLEFTFDSGTGALSAVLPAAEDGLHRLTLVAADTAGNNSAKSLELTFGEGDPDPFADMQGHWARQYTSYLYKLGVVSGIEENGKSYYKPDANMTRAQFSLIMANHLGIDVSAYESVELPFTDKDSIPSWSLGAVKAMYSLGYVKGSSDNGNLYFNASSSITRAEAMTIIGRSQPQGFPGSEMNFTDTSEIPSWASSYLSSLAGRGIISGYEDGSIRPMASVTRAQVAKILTMLT